MSTQLLNINPRRPVVFDPDRDVTGFWNDLPIGRTHNVLSNEDTGYMYAVGAQPRNSTCQSGLMFINLKNPARPRSEGCASEDGYVHDAQCLIYKGPDWKYWGREICYGYNEDSLTM